MKEKEEYEEEEEKEEEENHMDGSLGQWSYFIGYINSSNP